MKFRRLSDRGGLTPADRTRNVLTYNIMKAQNDLRERADLAIARQGVIGLYPDGPDKDKAVADFEAAKVSMLSAMGRVDTLRNELRSFIKRHEVSLSPMKPDDFPNETYTSHTIVENVYRDFYRRR